MKILYYLKLFILSLASGIGKADLERLCAECEKKNSRFLKFILKNQWRFAPVEQIINSLRLFSGYVYGLNNGQYSFNPLWGVYFDLKKNKPYDFEVEKLLIKYYDRGAYQNLPHSLSEAGELFLVDASFNSKFYGVKVANMVFDDYIYRFALSQKTLQKLVDTSIKLKNWSNLSTVLEYHNCLLTDDMRIKILLAEGLGYEVYSGCFTQYNMLNAPSIEVINALLQITFLPDNIPLYLAELLSHSWLENGKDEVLQRYPKLKAAILISEICHEACIVNERERKRMFSADYKKLLKVSNKGSYNYYKHPWIAKNTLPDGSYSMLALCYRFYLSSKSEAYYTGDILQNVLNYCIFYGGRLKEYVPQLQEFLQENQNKQ